MRKPGVTERPNFVDRQHFMDRRAVEDRQAVMNQQNKMDRIVDRQTVSADSGPLSRLRYQRNASVPRDFIIRRVSGNF